MFAMIRESWAWRYGRVMKTRRSANLQEPSSSGVRVFREIMASLRARWAVLKLRLVDHMIAARVRLLAFIGSRRSG